jgi:nicotinate-nucleotide adenylyltransferase
MAVRIGILGGSFDPIHIGHMAIAEYALEKLQLNKIIFVPAGDPWMKTSGLFAQPKDRFDMVKAAISDNDFFEISDIEISISGPSHSINTVKTFREALSEKDELVFILGQDAIESIDLWEKANELVTLCKFAVMPRKEADYVNPVLLENKVEGLRERTLFLDDMPIINISSTKVREQIMAGQQVEKLVPQKVADIINTRNLYKG